MKTSTIRILTFLKILCLLSCESKTIEKKAISTNDKKTIIKEIITLEKLRLDALNQRDTLAFKKLVSPDCVFINEQGLLMSIQKFLPILTNKQQNQFQEQFYTKNLKVELYQNNSIAIARGLLMRVRTQPNGVAVFNTIFSDVYIQGPTQDWTLINFQETRIK